MSDLGTSPDFPKGKQKLPPIPYDRIVSYTNLLGNPDDYRPQVRNTIITQSGSEVTLKTLNKVQSDIPLLVSLQDPTHEAGLNGLVSALHEHLNLATTDLSVGRDDFQYYSETLSLDDFNRRFPDQPHQEAVEKRLNKSYIISLIRRIGDQRFIQPVLYFRPEYVVNNTHQYKHHTDQVFFANLFNTIEFSFIDRDAAIARFVAKYALSGFPWPERRME